MMMLAARSVHVPPPSVGGRATEESVAGRLRGRGVVTGSCLTREEEVKLMMEAAEAQLEQSYDPRVCVCVCLHVYVCV